MLFRRRATLLAVLAVTACGSSTHATPTPSPRAVTTATPTPRPTPTADPCVVPHQSPPTGNIGASFATALAFAPDGRLFYTERTGTVRGKVLAITRKGSIPADNPSGAATWCGRMDCATRTASRSRRPCSWPSPATDRLATRAVPAPGTTR